MDFSIKLLVLAEVAGFEPANAGVKVPCLNLLATPQFYNPKCFDENGRGGEGILSKLW